MNARLTLLALPLALAACDEQAMKDFRMPWDKPAPVVAAAPPVVASSPAAPAVPPACPAAPRRCPAVHPRVAAMSGPCGWVGP